MMQHFVITRFNIASEGREAAIRNSAGWLDRRFDLFEAYCLPSMAAQTVKTFHWLVYFDEATPIPYYERIVRARQSIDFEPRFVGPFDQALVARDVAQRTGDDARIILTSRIDNDDAVAQDFIERIQDEASRAPVGCVLNFRNGLALQDGKIYTATDTSNPFTTLIEAGGRSAQTIWAARHHELGTKWTVLQVHGRPAWLQVVHSENVSNRIKGARVGDRMATRAFALDPAVNLLPVSRVELLWDLLVGYPMRVGREAAIVLAKRLIGRR
ncbi:glycosyltransferase [Novosphingobium sp.]|uniref:glycosyltransferase n=1 Tax=Novosphingobium sp. TaxID=1874826 RepID=UPI002607E841|nr:glycosyltransferase [Novosphingobium sp.]